MSYYLGGIFVFVTIALIKRTGLNIIMILSEERVRELKQIIKEDYGRDLTDAEARELGTGLLNLAELALEVAEGNYRRDQRLKKEPKGFHLDDGVYSCAICCQQIEGENSWYDKWGPKCLVCQKAVDEGIVPGFVCEHWNSWYTTWALKDKFNIHPATAKKMVRNGELKARIIPDGNGHAHEYIFLKKENPRLVCRYSPQRKSYDRRQNKITRIMNRETRRKNKIITG